MKFSSGAVAALYITSLVQDKSTTMSLAFAASSSNSCRRAAGTVVTGRRTNMMSKQTIPSFGITTISAVTATSTTSLSSMNRNQFCSLNDNMMKQSSSLFCSNNKMLNKKFNPLLLLSHRGGDSTGSALHMSTTTAEEQSSIVIEDNKPIEYFRTDYVPLSYTVTNVELDFNINDNKTIVTSKLTIRKNPNIASNQFVNELVLDGDEQSVTLKSLYMNNKELIIDIDYIFQPGKLIIKQPIDNSIITSIVEIVPENNTQLSGLYKSGSSYCTQCEAMGFRRITYYPDRPDNMAIFDKVRIEASKELYPILLSNGNLIEEGTVENNENNRHYAIWNDPFPKPSYLFATVAGNLGKIIDTYTTMSGRTVSLVLYSEHFNVNKLHYAMDALKRSMKWDEDRFGLEYDLDIFNVVAVEDFNMGAMENKSLNVFNTALILADTKTQTDSDFERVEGVIGHEYFHNWTGNRVTCRDWFQLTLKEGLTVFRDQEFSGDMNSKPVNRIENVRSLRASQFGEDAGPMSHPIRPESYISMDNFYTATVYSKGAEVIRMYQTILGVDGFNKGMKLYFERHDGQGVTCDDFLAAMADANDADLTQFSRWYSTPGTPTIKYATSYENDTFTLTLSQSSKNTDPLHIPVSVGFLDKVTGEEIVPTTVLNLKEMTQSFKFPGIKGDVVPSLLRDFSAPIKLEPEAGTVDEEALAFLAARDTDGFNRWEAGQKLYTSLIFQTMDQKQSDQTLEYVQEAFRLTLADTKMDYSIKAYALLLPAESSLSEELEIVDPIALHEARGAVKKAIAIQNKVSLRKLYDDLTSEMNLEAELKVDALSIGKRRLRNVLLEYLCSIRSTEEEELEAAQLAMDHYKNAKGMTDKMAAFTSIASMAGKGASYREEVIADFYKEANGDALVLNKWFTTQALADLPDIITRVRALKDSPDFTLKNPNRCRSLIGAFAMNPVAFHDITGVGYELMAEILAELDPINPQISSRLASSLIKWKRYDTVRGKKMKEQLEKLVTMKLSKDMYEIVSKGLK